MYQCNLRPAKVPKLASNSASAKSCRTSLPRLAPSANRVAISRRRAAASDEHSCNVYTGNPENNEDCRHEYCGECDQGCRVRIRETADWPSSARPPDACILVGLSRAMQLATTWRAAYACSTVWPALRRATSVDVWPCRIKSEGFRSTLAGTYRSGKVFRNVGGRKPSGRTPRTVYGRPLRTSVGQRRLPPGRSCVSRGDE